MDLRVLDERSLGRELVEARLVDEHVVLAVDLARAHRARRGGDGELDSRVLEQALANGALAGSRNPDEILHQALDEWDKIN